MHSVSKHTGLLVERHQFQGTSNHCGPYCAAMVINSITTNHVNGDVLAEMMNSPIWRKWHFPISRFPNSATFPWGIVTILDCFGVKAYWRPFFNLSDLSQQIERGNIPIVLTARLKPLSSHYRILASITPDEVGFIDPAKSLQEVTYRKTEGFLKKWRLAFNIAVMVNAANQSSITNVTGQ